MTEAHTSFVGPKETPGVSASFIDVAGMKKSFQRSGEEFVAVGDVSLSVERGSFLTVVGPAGCGKSTLLQMIAGLTAPTAGDVRFAGEPVTGPRST